jgi:hypothetical protein
LAKVVATVVVVVVVGELRVAVTTSVVTAETSRVTVGLPTVAVEAFKVAVEPVRAVEPRIPTATISQRGLAIAPIANSSIKPDIYQSWDSQPT